MAQGKTPKWQKQIEAITKKKFQGDELQRQLERSKKLLSLIPDDEILRKDTGQVVNIMLNRATRELPPLAAVYFGFQLGVALERLYNADRT